MSAPPRKQQQVSLRGASGKEITRDALLEKVQHERELRSYTRRAAAASLFIQRVWRRYYTIKKVSKQLQEEWEDLINHQSCNTTRGWISNNLLRPFLFFATQSSTLHQKLHVGNMKYMVTCFTILLQSINSADTERNFCCLVMGTNSERSTWFYQTRKLTSLCSFILAEYDHYWHGREDIAALTTLAMHLVVSLTDPRGWKCCKTEKSRDDADIASKQLLGFITRKESGIYSCLRRYFMQLGTAAASQKKTIASADDNFLILASALTLALRPLNIVEFDAKDNHFFDVKYASEQYCIFILTVPYLTQCLPSLLLPALKHTSTLFPCLRALMISHNTIFGEILKLEESETSASCFATVSCIGWALANTISLGTECNNEFGNSGRFVEGLDHIMYVRVVNSISECFLDRLENSKKPLKKVDVEHIETNPASLVVNSDTSSKVQSLYLDLLKPVHQQWHLRELLTLVKNIPTQDADVQTGNQTLEYTDNFGLLHVAYYYYYMLRIFSCLNPSVGSLPILNLLSFSPGFLVMLWESLEASIFRGTDHLSREVNPYIDAYSACYEEATLDKKQRYGMKDTGNKWVNVLQRISGKSTDGRHTNSGEVPVSPHKVHEDAQDLWDIVAMRPGAHGISKNLSCMLHLFCATYAHLLLILDDIEFYEKQVPFTLKQQQRIASVLNTFVYSSFIHNGGLMNKHLMNVAIRCLQLLYERDCRRRFCPSSLWLGPAREGRIPVAAAARAHEAASANLHSGDALSIPSMSSTLTTMPHVYPFEERVQMFREFVKLDRVARRVAGEVSGPGSGSIEIVIRRDYIVEDGYKQLNSLGSRLKSCINVSFVSECGLPEAGLDYGGLSKEFLTDISKAVFDPKYGLFSQSSTSERNLIPNMSARLLENGIEMFEFLGRIVGKALYEGILLDYSFSLVFVQKLLGRYSFLDELSALDSELYKNLMYVKHYDGDVAELALDFTVTEELHGKRSVLELRPGGKNISVTNENKLHYVHAIADYKLNRQILPFANAFYRGLIDLISPSWLSLFNANEFNQLLSGGKHDFDVDDLRSNTRYTGGYSEGSRTVKLFWEVIRGLRANERCMLLKFVTSCSRAPLLGFKHLQPSFTIHKVACDVPLWASIGGQDVDRLPSASTCYNTLKLPTYKRPSTLRNKLLYAISSNTGFELS